MVRTILVFILLQSLVVAQNVDTIHISNYNVENLFDTNDDPQKRDEDFLPNGSNKWTNERYQKKLDSLGRVILDLNQDKAPDVIGFEEVENLKVLEDLTSELSLRNYKIVHEESPDFRGIDNALFYDDDKFDFISMKSHKVKFDDDYVTRTILEVKLKHKFGEEFYFFVNHWPSRRGGQERSEPRRIAAAKVLDSRVEEILAGSEANIVILGDFNDEPNNNSLINVLEAKSIKKYKELNADLINLSFLEFERGYGSYNYRNDWNMLDQIIISKSLIDEYIENSFKIFKPKYLVNQKGKYKDYPIRTYAGRKYLGGYSDHLPVSIKLILNN